VPRSDRLPQWFFLPTATPRSACSTEFVSSGIFGSPRKRTSPGQRPLVYAMALPSAERGSARCVISQKTGEPIA
jgi:hypothetical protein